MVDQHLLKLTIARVDEPVFSGDVLQVSVPGIVGDMTILANHQALISPLKSGVITLVKENGDIETFTIKFGTLEIANNQATILI